MVILNLNKMQDIQQLYAFKILFKLNDFQLNT